jgi:hypothetical protein
LSPVTDSTPVDISAASGLSFYYKGTSCDVRVETLSVTDFGYFFHRLPEAPDWTLVSLKWSDFSQAIWAKKATFDLTKSTKVAWQTTDKGVTGQAGSIAVDEIHLPGFVVPTVGISMRNPGRTPMQYRTGREGGVLLLGEPGTLRRDVLGRGEVQKRLVP